MTSRTGYPNLPHGGRAATAGTATRRSLLLAGVAASGVVSAACNAPGVPGAPSPAGSTTAASGTVDFWFSIGQEREPMMLEINRAFEAKYPSIKITWEHAAGDTALRDKLVTVSAAGNPPDVAQLNVPFVPLLVAGDALADLEALAARDRGFQLNTLFDPTALSLAKSLTLDSKLYALPRGGGLLHYYYNRDAFAQLGLKDPNELYDAKQWTWDAAVDAAVKLTRRSGTTYERYGHAADYAIMRPLGIMAANGGQFYDVPKRRFVFADAAAGVAAIQWLVDLKDRHAVTVPYPPPEGEPTNPQTLFASGKAAMFHGLASYLAALTPQIGTSFRYGIAPMPVGKKEATYGNAAGGMGVFKGGKRPDLGWELAKYYAGVEAYVISVRHNYIQVPLLSDKRAKDAYLSSGVHGIDRVLKHSATAVTETFAATNLGDIRAAFDRQMTNIWQGKAPVRSALTTAQSDMQALLDQNVSK